MIAEVINVGAVALGVATLAAVTGMSGMVVLEAVAENA